MASVVSVKEMRTLDQATMKKHNISSFELMLQAGEALFEAMRDDKVFHINDEIIVVSGTGNNGGDGVVIASHLKRSGYHIHLFVMGEEGSQSEESLQAIKQYKGDITYIVDEDDIKEMKKGDVLIDALFGIGLDRNVEGLYFQVIKRMNQIDARTKVSVDVASGLHANNGQIMGIACIVDTTYVVEHLVYGNVLGDALDVSNRNRIVPVGINEATSHTVMIDDVIDLLDLPNRPRNAHKYYYGRVCTIGGAKGMMGAPILTALSAYRSGSGLVRVLYDEEDKDYIPYEKPDILIDTYTHLNDIMRLSEQYDAWMIGPGLSRYKSIFQRGLQQFLRMKTPLVVDADGLYYMKDHLHEITEEQQVVLTPHTGEFASLLGISTKELLADPMYYVCDFVSKYPVVLVLKGPCTIIASKEEIICSTLGDPALAVAGSGDVLTGIIGSFLGRETTAFNAAVYGVYIHSMASKDASNLYGEDSVMASDVVDSIPTIIKGLKQGNH